MTQVDDLEGLGHPDRFTGLLVISHLTLQIHPKDRSRGRSVYLGGVNRLAKLGETLGAGVNVGVKKSEGVRPSAHSPFTLQIQIPPPLTVLSAAGEFSARQKPKSTADR